MSILKRFRSSRTGQYVTKAEAQANEDTTVSETVNSSPTRPVKRSWRRTCTASSATAWKAPSNA
jgi:hypothetical protein